MTGRAGDRYDRKVGGASISGQADTTYDFDRLERAVCSLLEKQRTLEQENARLYRELAERDRRIGALDGRVLELNQRRQDVGKRIDELLSQIDQLDARLGVASG